MSTLISGTTSWLSAAEFAKRADVRTVADVLGDAGLRLYQNPDGTINQTSLAADANLAAALASASGQFEADVFVGERYTVADLTLISTTTCNAQAYMFDLIANIARMKVIGRRLEMDPEMKVPEWYKETKEQLQRIRHGDAIFGLLEVQQAGLPDAVFVQSQDWDAVDFTSTQARPFFGRRNKDMRRPGFPGSWWG